MSGLRGGGRQQILLPLGRAQGVNYQGCLGGAFRRRLLAPSRLQPTPCSCWQLHKAEAQSGSLQGAAAALSGSPQATTASPRLAAPAASPKRAAAGPANPTPALLEKDGWPLLPGRGLSGYKFVCQYYGTKWRVRRLPHLPHSSQLSRVKFLVWPL